MQTLGDVITAGLILAALIVVPYKLAKAWIWPSVRPFFMSSDDPEEEPFTPVVARVASTPTIAPQPIATPGNAANAELSGNAVAGIIPSEARDIIRMQAKAEAVARLLKTAKMTNKAEAIELIFECKRNGREGSMYKRAVVLVDAILNEQKYPELNQQHQQVADQPA